MNKLKKVLIMVITMALVSFTFLITACSSDEEEISIKSDWEFSCVITSESTIDKTKWNLMNAVDPSNSIAYPTFNSDDGEHCVLQYYNKDHEGILEQQDDGSYEISDPDSGKVWGHVTIEGETMRLVLGDNVGTIEFVLK